MTLALTFYAAGCVVAALALWLVWRAFDKPAVSLLGSVCLILAWPAVVSHGLVLLVKERGRS